MATLKQSINDLRTRFSQLEQREQFALLSLGSFLLVVVFYLLIWVPVHDFKAESQLLHDRHLKLLSYLQSTESQARSAASGDGRASPTSGRPLLTSVSGTAQSVGITPSRLQPEGAGAVSVWFDAVPFTQLMLLLERLESSQGIVVRQISIDDRDETGQVSARLVLRR